jgi:hypothetical protein
MTLCFRIEPVLNDGMAIADRAEELLDAWQRTASGCGSRLDGLVGTVEIIPSKRLDVWSEDQVRVTLPYFELMFLGGAYGAADNLKDVGWRAAMYVVDADANSHYMGGTKFACGEGWNLRH